MHAELVQQGRDTPDLAALWRQLVEDPDAPDRFELSEHGELIVSPRATKRHQALLWWTAQELQRKLGGCAMQEVPLKISTGVRVPDVVWVPSEAFSAMLDAEVLMTTPPPVVVEVLSPGDRTTEIAHKVALYLGFGVREVIVLDLAGQVAYHRPDGAHEASAMGADLTPPKELFT